MKWGVRRYQNKDGTLTSLGKKQYSDSDLAEIEKASKRFGIIGGAIKKHQIDKRNAKATEEEKKKTDVDPEFKKDLAKDMAAYSKEKYGNVPKEGESNPLKYFEREKGTNDLLRDPNGDYELKELCFMEWVETYHPDMDVETYDRESNKFFNNPDKYRYEPNSGPKHQYH